MRPPSLLVTSLVLSQLLAVVFKVACCVLRFPWPADRVPAPVRSWKCHGILECNHVTALTSSVLVLNFSLLYEFCTVSKFKGFFSGPPQPQPLLVPDLQVGWGFWQLCCTCLVLVCCWGFFLIFFFSLSPLVFEVWQRSLSALCMACLLSDYIVSNTCMVKLLFTGSC